VEGVFLKCSLDDVPKPYILVFEGFENLPRFPNPSLTGLSGYLRFDLLRSGEQIPQVSVIMRPISRNVHGDGMKRSELI
jgi:hypothetical protein